MKVYLTEIMAIDPKTGEQKTWCGPEVLAKTWEEAETWLTENGYGYCKVIGNLIPVFYFSKN